MAQQLRAVGEAEDKKSEGEKKPSRQVVALKSMAGALPRLLLTTLWPLVVMFGGYLAGKFFVPQFAGRIAVEGFDPWIFAIIVGQLVAMGVWLWYNIKVAQWYRTNAHALATEAVVSIIVALCVVGVGGVLVGKDVFPWYYLIPMIFTIFDGTSSASVGINNAVQKPLFQQNQ